MSGKSAAGWGLTALAMTICAVRATGIASAGGLGGRGRERPTFHRDVAPILYRTCADCHRAGGSGPFSLLRYQDVARRARQIAVVTESRFMPPWKAALGGVSLRDARGLSAAEIRLLQEWAKAGAPEGEPGSGPPPPPPPADWPAGPPDLVLAPSAAYEAPAEGLDVYRRFVFRLSLPRDRWIRMAAFRPGNARVTRMALLSVDATGLSREIALHSGGESYASMVGGIFPQTDTCGAWSPGAVERPLPDGTAVLARRDADLVVLVRMHPDGRPERMRFEVGLYFAEAPPRGVLATIPLNASDLSIRAGEAAHTVRLDFVLPVDVTVYGILAHAHMLCRSVRAEAVLPSGTRIQLLAIPDWDMNWQQLYTYETPIGVPAGACISALFTYDNSAGNPRNPSSPPKRVMAGVGSMDEMACLQIQVAPRRAADLSALRSAIAGDSEPVQHRGP